MISLKRHLLGKLFSGLYTDEQISKIPLVLLIGNYVKRRKMRFPSFSIKSFWWSFSLHDRLTVRMCKKNVSVFLHLKGKKASSALKYSNFSNSHFHLVIFG